MTQTKRTQNTTPRGEALWAHTLVTEKFDGKDTGKFSIQIKLNKAETEALQALHEKEVERAKEDPAFKGKKWLTEPNLGVKEEKNGDLTFKFATKAETNTRAGEVIKKVIPVFDAAGKPYKGPIGNGSIIKVRYTIAPYWMTKANNGVTLYLEAIQVLELVEYGGNRNASAYGFEAEEGFVASEESGFDAPDAPMDTEDSEGDF